MRYALLLFVMFHIVLSAQEQTIGLFHNSPQSFNGYTLFSPMQYSETYLMDNCGKLVHKWQSKYKPGFSSYLLEDGTLLHPGTTPNPSFPMASGLGGIIEILDWEGNVIWSYKISDTIQAQHHDIEPMPNGNILVLCWDLRTAEEAIQAGRNPNKLSGQLWSEKIIELKPLPDNKAEIVWEWYLWDHLIQDFDSTKDNYGDVAAHPERMDINYSGAFQRAKDWLHMNSVDYNPVLDQIILSVHNVSEVWIIDHKKGSEISGTQGRSSTEGEILWRWGNPIVYRRGTFADKKLFGQHDARWIDYGLPDEGKIMVFNNGWGRYEGNYSTIDIIDPPLDDNRNYVIDDDSAYGPKEVFWQYNPGIEAEFFSANISGAERMPNGNTLICEGASGEFHEVDVACNTVWYYVNPVGIDGPMPQGTVIGGGPGAGFPNTVFRIKRYPTDYPAFAGKNLASGQPVELNPYDYDCELYTSVDEITAEMEDFHIFPNPADDFININLADKFRENRNAEVQIFNLLGICVLHTPLQKRIDVSSLDAGTYIFKTADMTKKLIILR